MNWIYFVVFGFAILLIFVGVILEPRNISRLISNPHPVNNYTEAVERIDILKKNEPGGMNPVCKLKFMSHGSQAENVIVLVHGYTNCPQQFEELGNRFFNRGWNVLIAPLPHHGLADRMTLDQSLLKAEELSAYADEMIDIAQGLGNHVIMMGISLGGVITSWAAQFRKDIDRAIVISPAFGFKQVPTHLTAAFMNIYSLLPNTYAWWNPETKDALLPPVYTYPRYSSHALAQALRLGFATITNAQRSKPAVKKLVLVLNDNDTAVNNEFSHDVCKIWQGHAANISTYVFEASLKLGHDLIDPTQKDQRIDIVYPRLIELATQ